MEGLRGFAVLLVFCVHFFGTWATVVLQSNPHAWEFDTVSGGTDLLLYWLFRSHHGVSLFFVLSGFLISRMVLFARGFDYLAFLRNRALRLYPALFLSLIFSTWVMVEVFHVFPFDWRNFAANLALLYGSGLADVNPYNPPIWSLWWEAVFYVVFPATLLYWRHGLSERRLAFLGAAMLLPGAALLYWNPYAFANFFAGVAVGLATDQRLRQWTESVGDEVVAALYLLVSVAYFTGALGHGAHTMLYAGAGALLLAQAAFGTGWLNRLFCAAPLRALGNVSYSFYLLHYALTSWFISLVMHWGWASAASGRELSRVLLLAGLAFAVVTAGAALLYLAAERPYFARKQHAVPRA
jgi:peptidoglycan/LPS O-acetylase OafA/YrhL